MSFSLILCTGCGICHSYFLGRAGVVFHPDSAFTCIIMHSSYCPWHLSFSSLLVSVSPQALWQPSPVSTRASASSRWMASMWARRAMPVSSLMSQHAGSTDGLHRWGGRRRKRGGKLQGTSNWTLQILESFTSGGKEFTQYLVYHTFCVNTVKIYSPEFIPLQLCLIWRSHIHFPWPTLVEVDIIWNVC